MPDVKTVSSRRRRVLRTLIPARPPAPRPSSVLRALLIELRPTQWVKNFACFAGLIFSGRLFQVASQLEALIGFGSFCFASSSIYILNDYFDREKDRHNPRTASRPLASGALPLGVAAIAFMALLLATWIGSVSLGRSCALVMLAYGALNVFYSIQLKEIVIADVMCIALGFVLRVMYGVYAVGSQPTPWIVLCMFFLALFLGFAKRKAELVHVRDETRRTRPVLNKYASNYLDVLLTMSSTMAILCYATFTVASHRNPTLVITIVPVVYCVYRYMLQVIMHAHGESPDKVLVSVKRLWLGIFCWLYSYVAIYYCNVNIFAEVG
jgi:4-hydroxybenzoate polyprenyltransferase